MIIFSKKLLFKNFDWSNLIFDQSKSYLKNSVSLCWFNLSNLFFDQSNIMFQVFLKTVLWLIQTTFQKFFSNFSSLSDLARQHKIFLSFSTSIFARFSSFKAGMTILSLLLFLFSCFHAFKGYFRTSLNLGIFVDSRLFFWNWSLGFVRVLLYSWLLLVSLINLGFYEELKIIWFILNLIWGFCLIGLKLMKLACWFDVIDHSKLFSNLCNDQLVNFI